MIQGKKISVILLAGGIGSRMGAHLPKQFLQLGNKPLARHSFDLFLSIPEIDEIIVVCSPDFREYFTETESKKNIFFALPGERRQDSVYQGLLQSTPSHELICIHDAARPFIDRLLVQRVLEAGCREGAATVGMPLKFTVKESDPYNYVVKTPDRSHIWEVQTPQVIDREALLAGFSHAYTHNITVTDDVSLVELIGKKVQLVEGAHTNLKVTVPSDLAFAMQLLRSQNSI